MRYSIFLINLVLLGFISCKSTSVTKKETVYIKSPRKFSADPNEFESKSNSVKKLSKKILQEAKKYLGTPYKFGGTSRSGIDCSGLIFNAFVSNDFKIPRVSREQAQYAKEVKISEVIPGDLLFFSQNKSTISHAGIVENIADDGEIFFIHSSTSKGVIITSLNTQYWSERFVKAGRIIN